MSAAARLWRERKPELFCAIFCAFVLIALGRVLVRRTLFIETVNATFQGYAVALSSEVEGQVVRVLVAENQPVRVGQILCILDDSRWQAKLHQAEAERDALRARSQTAQRDLARAAHLIARSAIPFEAYDQARANAGKQLREMKAAEARADQARVNEVRTRIMAPADGVIAFRTARVGFVAKPGAPLFGFVDRKARWVLAKVRETDVADLHVGKPVQVHLDAMPGREFKGKITSISPTTERRFYSAVPADFSAGNFTKYVQWYPIRIALALNAEDEARIPVGTSAAVHMTRD